MCYCHVPPSSGNSGIFLTIRPISSLAAWRMQLFQLPILSLPAVGNIVVMGIHLEFIRLLAIENIGGTVDADGFLLAYALETVKHEIRDLDQQRVVFAQKKFVYFTSGGRIISVIIQYQLDHSFDYCKIVYLPLMIVPALDHTRIGGGHVNLPKFEEQLVVFSNYLHQTPPFI
jgi:hypothetical protein